MVARPLSDTRQMIILKFLRAAASFPQLREKATKQHDSCSMIQSHTAALPVLPAYACMDSETRGISRSMS